MLLIGSLGFSSLVLVVSFVFPVIALIIHRKWRLAVAREEEIKRLLALASEEAARAELEASYDYGYGEVSVPQYHQCAVCFSPTTTRCSRCKAVRYCSGKCQIVHWRQGHKEECRPASITQSINEQGIYSSQKGSEQDHSNLNSDQYNRFEGRQPKKPIDLSCESSASSETTASPEVPRRKNEEVLVECHSDGEGASSTSESSGTSFSGFTASHSSSESSDDVSVCESTSSNECEKQDRPTSAEISLNKLETSSSTKVLDGSRPLSPKFASLVDSADNLTKLNKLNNFRRVCNGEGQCKSNCSSRLGNSCICDGLNAESSESSGFWGQTFESKSDASNGRGLSNPDEGSNQKFSDSGSALLFSFNFPPTPPLSAKSSEGKGIVSDDPCPSALGSNMPPDGVVASGIRNSVSLKMSSHVMNGSASGPQVSKSRGAKSAVFLSSEVPLPPVSKRDSISNDTSCKNSVISLNHHKSNHATNHKSTSYPLKSRELECWSSSGSDPQLSYSASLHRTPIAKSERADTVQAHSAVSSGFMSSSNGVNGLKSSIWKAVDQFKGSKLSKQSAPGVGSEPAGRYSDKGLFSYESFVKLFNWNKVELQPCGLINCGNSCYANAVLQCLAFTPPLSAYFLQGLHSKECPKKDWCFSCEFENLILKAKEGRPPLSPVGILSQLQKIGSQLGNGREEDAHEFLRYAIDTMQSVCLKKAGMSASGPPEEETTLIGLTFGGYLRSKIKCMKCQSKSERQERMMDLTVEIEGDIGSLEEALRRFTATEVLDGENKYQCSRCKSYEKAKKKLTILEAPNVLTIALKRFQSGKFGKLNKSIQFPEILNLAPYMSGSSDKLPIYRLYGVVVHLDVMNAAFSGHYVCYVKNTQNKWFKVDDSTVTTTDLERVLTKGAYMLLYARCSPRGPRLLRNRMIASDVKNKPIPPCISGKRTTSKLKSPPAHPSVAEMYQSSIPSNDPASIENFYSGFHRLQRILEEDSTSDGSSLLSNSDEASCSTDSTRDSSGTDDFSDFIFGDSGFGWNSPWRNSSDSDTGSSSSSSSSPLYSRQSPLANLDQYDHTESGLDCGRVSTQSYNPLEGTGNDSSLHFTKQCRKSDSSNISGSSSSYRNTNSERLRGIRPFKDVKAGAILRKST